ncbi:MAG: hypothetical protein OXN84_12300 [Albidovulum sp.]|nr:hypothetical protein [Albidovulum sp.]MDE0534124.1 hypothetical protein [Albidovulum sp.]
MENVLDLHYEATFDRHSRTGRLNGSLSAATRDRFFKVTGSNAVEENRLTDEFLRRFLEYAIRLKGGD